MNLETVLRRLYSSEINCGLQSFYDGDWEAWIGDDLNGRRASVRGCEGLPDVARWLDQHARIFYPQSEYAKSKAPFDVSLRPLPPSGFHQQEKT